MKKRLIITEQERYRILNLHKSRLIKEHNPEPSLSPTDDPETPGLKELKYKMENEFGYTFDNQTSNNGVTSYHYTKGNNKLILNWYHAPGKAGTFKKNFGIIINNDTEVLFNTTNDSEFKTLQIKLYDNTEG